MPRPQGIAFFLLSFISLSFFNVKTYLLTKNIYLSSDWLFQENTKDTILSTPTVKLILKKKATYALVWPQRKTPGFK